MTIKEIDNKILELKAERRKLENEERENFLESAKSNVGRCFKVNNTFVKVLDVPQVGQTMTGVNFNQYQYPAIWLDDEEDIPFFIDTLFSGAWGIGHNPTRTEYKEISKEEFNAEFDRRVSEFVKMVKEK